MRLLATPPSAPVPKSRHASTELRSNRRRVTFAAGLREQPFPPGGKRLDVFGVCTGRPGNPSACAATIMAGERAFMASPLSQLAGWRIHAVHYPSAENGRAVYSLGCR